MAEKKGNGSATAQRANAKAAKEGTKNPRTSSAAQAELGRKGGKTEEGLTSGQRRSSRISTRGIPAETASVSATLVKPAFSNIDRVPT